MISVIKRCLMCGELSSIDVPELGYVLWQAGTYVQDAFPTLTADQREQLMTGTHPHCWDLMFPPEEQYIGSDLFDFEQAMEG